MLINVKRVEEGTICQVSYNYEVLGLNKIKVINDGDEYNVDVVVSKTNMTWTRDGEVLKLTRFE